MAAGPGTPGTPPPPQLKMNGRKRARTEAEKTEDEDGQQQAPPVRSHTARETSVFTPLFSTLLFLNPSKTQSSIFSTKMSLNSSSPFRETRISTLTQFRTSLGISRQNPELTPAIHRSKKLDPPWGTRPLSNQTAVPTQLFASWAAPGPSHLALCCSRLPTPGFLPVGGRVRVLQLRMWVETQRGTVATWGTWRNPTAVSTHEGGEKEDKPCLPLVGLG